jgi:hypothetical protein
MQHVRQLHIPEMYVLTTKLLRMSATKIQAIDLIFDGTVGYKKKFKSAAFKYTHHILDGYSKLLESKHLTNLNSGNHFLLWQFIYYPSSKSKMSCLSHQTVQEATHIT